MSDKKMPKKDDLMVELEDLQKQNDLLVRQYTDSVDSYNEEVKAKRELLHTKFILEGEVFRLSAELAASKELRKVERRKRLAAVPKFVIAGAVALVALVVPYTLQQMSVIGPQFGFAIEAVLLMVIAWCYALIWDRSRKN